MGGQGAMCRKMEKLCLSGRTARMTMHPLPDPWLEPSEVSSAPADPPPRSSTGNRVVSPGQPGPEEEFAAIFHQFDADGDGRITPAEAERTLAAMAGAITAADGESLRKLLRTHGELTLPMFARWAQECTGLDGVACLLELFGLIDVDGNGSLCVRELTAFLQALEPECSPQRVAAFMADHDLDADGILSVSEFVGLLRDGHGLALSIPVLKRLKKTLLQYISGTRSGRIGLVEVDCDLGAGTPGAGSGIELLKQAARKEIDLHLLRESLIEEIAAGTASPRARASDSPDPPVDSHARHIQVIARVMEQAAGHVAATRRRKLFPVVLAGDHSTAAGTIAGLRRAHPDRRLGVIWIDAHADLHSPFTTPSGNMHGMPLAVATGHDNLHHAINEPHPTTLELWEWCKSLAGDGAPPLDLRDLIYIGVRDTEPAEEASIRAHGLPIVSVEEVRRTGPEAAAARCLHYLRDCDLLYVSFDVDSLDATVCKGTGTPVPDGLWPCEALEIHRTLMADPRVVCWEICEINPHLDPLNSIAEISLGIYRTVLEVLEDRL